MHFNALFMTFTVLVHKDLKNNFTKNALKKSKNNLEISMIFQGLEMKSKCFVFAWEPC